MSSNRFSLLAALFSSVHGLTPTPPPVPTPPPAPTPTPPPAPAPAPGEPALSTAYVPVIPGVGVAGKPLSYTMPAGYAGTITGQQWYINDGTTGPVAVAGATSATWTPSSGHVGYWPSVHVWDASNSYRSLEFQTTNTPVSNTGGVLSGNAASTGGIFRITLNANGLTAPLTLNGVATVRVNDKFLSSTTAYVENVLAPGTYPTAGMGTSLQVAALDAAVGRTPMSLANAAPYLIGSPGTPKILPQTAQPAATATRPAGNTGNGFFVAANGYVYDPMGVEFRIRGVNQNFGANSWPGIPNSGANCVRIWIDLSRADHCLPPINTLIANNIVPMLATSGMQTWFSASFSGTTMTVSSMGPAPLGGYSGRIWVGMNIVTNDGNGSFVNCTVTADASTDGTLTGNGLAGTYRVSVSQTVAGTVALKCTLTTTSGSVSTYFAAAMAQMWNDNISVFASIMKYIMLNPMNEWGPQGSASNTVWKDFYSGSNGIPGHRAAGWTCPISIDAPSSGQDNGDCWTILNHGHIVAASDTFASVILNQHIYQKTLPGAMQTIAPSLASMRDTYGIAFMYEEFGQGQPNTNFSIDNSATTNIEVMSVAEAYNFGWMPWAWDESYGKADGTASVDNSTYSMTYNYAHSYATKNPADLTKHGYMIVKHPVFGLEAIAQKATPGSFS